MKVSELTLEEKIGLIHGAAFFRNKGVERLGIPPIVMSDGPMGVRHEIKDTVWEPACETDDYVTYFPCNMALAATWNRELAHAAGYCLGAEARGRGKDMILAPGINMVRTPLCGRNFEYMGEDPFLTAEIAVPFIKGIQENDVAACVKHFAVNNQETRRMDVNVEVDEMTLREFYLPAFEACVKEAGVYAVMGAYNKLRGVHCSHNSYLLDRILREEWGFDGVIVSDWSAVHDTGEAAESGLDMEMSTEPDFDNYYMARPLLEQVKKGVVSETCIDRKAEHILALTEKLKIGKSDRKKGTYNSPAHREIVYRTAKESIVLLKNEGILPLDEKTAGRIGIVGENAQMIHALGGGSAEIKALYEISPILGIRMYLGGNCDIRYEKGYSQNAEENQEALKRRAVSLAGQVDTLIYIGGLNHSQDSEGMDRKDMKIPYGQDELILELLEQKPDMTIVLLSGAPVEMRRFSQKAKAVVQQFYSGCEGGRALGEVLFGAVNPSGKLPVTFPKRLEDSPAHYFGAFPGEDNVFYKEGILVGYRYYDASRTEPEFCFGHGLSYTDFAYTELIIDRAVDLGSFRLGVKVKNTGECSGAEIVQVYAACPDAGPFQQLKAFGKLELRPEEEREIIMELPLKAFASYDAEKGKWIPWKGSILIRVGSSSRDIRLEQEVRL